MSHRLWGNNQASTSQGQASSSTFAAANQKVPFMKFTTQMTVVIASHTTVKFYADFQRQQIEDFLFTEHQSGRTRSGVVFKTAAQPVIEGKNRASTSQGHALSLTSAAADQEISFLKFTIQMDTVTKALIVFKIYADFQQQHVEDFLFTEHQYRRIQFEAAFKTVAQPIIEVSEPSTEEVKEDAQIKVAKNGSRGRRHKEHEGEKEHAHESIVEIEHEDAAEKNENIEEDEDDPEKAWKCEFPYSCSNLANSY
ncbi:hypothetical protein LWI28_013436 [Acer negundo]|uniref:Uncharacterized protein n=1 Tax=Acer negundo TaxID=4023 RepID=A0AAD5J649_ACENE|nr:hypothetical protein LWI28_013436 [Acer negundo]